MVLVSQLTASQGETQQLHGAGADAQVVAQLDEAHQVGLGSLQDGPGFGHGRRGRMFIRLGLVR